MKKETFVPIISFTLGFLFIIISLLVFFTRGKSKSLIAKKIKIGALILTLSSAASCYRTQTTCYAQAAINQLRFKTDNKNGSIIFDLNKSNKYSAYIDGREHDNYSFQITDDNGSILYKNDIVPVDSVWDDSSEEILITINKIIPEGTYYFVLYKAKTSEQNDATQLYPTTIEIKYQ